MNKKEIAKELMKLRLELLKTKTEAASNEYFSPPEFDFNPLNGYPDFALLAEEFANNLLDDFYKIYEDGNNNKNI